MTMVPAQNLSKQQQQHHHLLNADITTTYYGGCAGNNDYTTERFGGIMSQKSEGYDYYCSTTDQSCLGSDLVNIMGDRHPMADDQDESRTNSFNNDAASSNSNKQEQQQATTTTTNIITTGIGHLDQDQDHHDHDHDHDHEGWLQLSIGGHSGIIRHENKTHHHQVLEPIAVRRGGGGGEMGLNTVELDLLPGGGGGGGGGLRSTSMTMFEGPSISTIHDHHLHHHQIGGLNIPRGSSIGNFGNGTNFSTTSLMYYQQYYPGSSSTSSNFPHHQEAINNWAFRPLIPHQQYVSAASCPSPSSTSSILIPHLGSTTPSYLARQFQLHPPVFDATAAAGPSVDFRVVNPPRRHHSGIWFMLQASQNQAKEPFLPQISKSFLRIKDGRMQIRLLIKYLVNKLRLDSESEIEITCRGQQLLPYLTLQHVRDNIWGPTLTLLPDSSSITDHVMVLHYSRSA